MSISSSNRKAGPYTCNGVTASFPFAFKVFATSDVLVVQADLSGVETTKTLTADYTVALSANQDTNPGGTVTMNAAPLNGYLLTIGSQVTYTQGMVLTNTGGFFPQVLNDMADRVVILVQQLFEKLNRAVTLPFSASGSVSTQLPSPVAGKVIGWRADGLGLDNFDPATAVGLFVSKTATSGSAILPGGPTANRDATPGQGYFRFNSQTNVLEWFNGTTWVSVTDATLFAAALAAGLQLGGLNTLTKAGDQWLLSQDISGLREGSCSVASGDLYTVLGWTVSSVAMKYQTHNFPISATGMFGPRDETGDGWLKVTTEGSQERYYYVASGTAGVAPLTTDVTLMATFDYPTGASSSPTLLSYRNLKIDALGINNYNTVITADEVVLKNSTNLYKTFRGVNLTVNANGTIGAPLSISSARTANTWYYRWLFYNATNGLTATLDTSSVSPLPPTGYTNNDFKALLPGASRTDTAGYLLQISTRGRKSQYVVLAGSNVAALPVMASGAQGNVTTGVYVAVAVGAFTPATAVVVSLVVSNGGNATVIVAPNASYGGYQSATNQPPFNVDFTNYATMTGDLLLETVNIYYAGAASCLVFAKGWEDNI